MSVLGVIVDSISLSRTFPKPIDHEVSRDALLISIEDLLEKDFTLISLEGASDSGKTQTLSQLIRRRSSASISLFMRPDSWYLQNPNFLYSDLATQAKWLLEKIEPAQNFEADETVLRSLFFNLQKQAKQENKLIYIVVDGIDDLGPEAAQFVASVARTLPVEFSQYRFVVSGDAKWIPMTIISTASRKNITVTGFTLLEATTFLDGLNLNQSDVDSIFRSCARGNPGFLASARRSLESGISATNLIDTLPERFQDRYLPEWHSCRPNDDDISSILAILAHDKNSHSISEVSAITSKEASEVRRGLSRCSFIDLASDDESAISFVSEAFRRFAAGQLKAMSDEVWQTLADFYLRADSDATVDRLSTYLDQAHRPTDLLRILEPTTFVRLLSATDSFLPLEERCSLGLRTALAIKRFPDAVRFQIQKGIACGISDFHFDRSEVIAHLALNDYPAALSLAQGAVLKKHRLQLMSAIARMQKAQGLTPEPTLIQAIESLSAQLDPREMGADLINVASDLLPVRPDLALAIIARLAPNNTNSRNIDVALLKLSAIAASNTPNFDQATGSAVADIQSKIKSPSTREIAKTVAMLAAGETAEEILRQVRELPSASEKLFLLRQWCSRASRPSTAGPVINYAVFLSLRTTEYSPTATDFREICEPLPHITDTTLVSSLITALDLQKDSVRNAGPTREYVRWQLLIARAEQRLNATRAGQRLAEVYLDVTSLKEVETRAVSMALIVGALDEVDPTGASKDTADIRDMSEGELMADVKILLNSTAMQYPITRGIVEALAVARPDLALSVIDDLNYENRRDWATTDLSEYLLESPEDKIPFQTLESLLGRWADIQYEDEFVSAYLKRFVRIQDLSLIDTQKSRLVRLIERVIKIADPCIRCEALSNSLALIARLSSHDDTFRLSVESALSASRDSIADPTDRLTVSFDAVRLLADHRRELALEYLQKADSERLVYDNLSSTAFIQCLRLLVRSFVGLLPLRLHQPTDIDRIGALIGRVSSDAPKAQLWADLAARMFRLERDQEARDVVQSRLRPLLNLLKEEKPFTWAEVVIFCSPALYAYSPVGAMEHFSSLTSDQREEAIRGIIDYLLTGYSTREPAGEENAPGFQVSYERSLEILNLIEHVETDIAIFRVVRFVVNSAIWKHNKFGPSQEQKSDLFQRINNIALRKFPNPRFIKHDGFAILTHAQANRLLREKQVDWTPLVERAKNVSNAADKAFVLTFLAESVHPAKNKLREELFELAHETARTIPATEDRAERLQLLASNMRDFDRTKAKLILREAINVVGKITYSEGSQEEIRKSIVDLAYQIDPEYANSVSSILDQDAGRNSARARIAYQEAKTRIREGEPKASDSKHLNLKELGDMSWELLGSLNADRVKPLEIAKAAETLELVSNVSLREAFPVISWFIENLIRKRSFAKESAPLLREMFEAVLSASEVGGALLARAAGRSISPAMIGATAPNRTLIGAGQRAKSLGIIADWVEELGETFLYVCDPYFGMKELELLNIVLKAKPDLVVQIITSKKRQEEDRKNITMGLSEAFEDYWRLNFSEQRPPETEIIIVGDSAQDLPVHDRWMLTSGGGIRLGTSFNQLGVSKDSEISRLSSAEYEDRLQETKSLIERQKLGKDGRKLSYETFWL